MPPVKIKWGWIKRIQDQLDRFRDYIVGERESDVNFILQRFMEELEARQPIGQLDPYVDAFPEWPRDPRPSVRQGNTPIELGWSGRVVDGKTIEIESGSKHLQYFTRWTGRRWLGTRKGRPQVAQNAKTLAFWWLGEGHWPVYAKGGGFVPESDFVQDAYDAIKPEISFVGRRLLERGWQFLVE